MALDEMPHPFKVDIEGGQAPELHDRFDANGDANRGNHPRTKIYGGACPPSIFPACADSDGWRHLPAGELKNCSRQRVVGSNPTAGTREKSPEYV